MARTYNRKYTADIVEQAHKLYVAGAPRMIIEERTGVGYNYLPRLLQNHGKKIPTRQQRRERRPIWVDQNTDWSLLDNLEIVRNVPGYSTFTREGGEKIKEIYRTFTYLTARDIASRLEVLPGTISNILAGYYNYKRIGKPTKARRDAYENRRKHVKTRDDDLRPWRGVSK